MAFGIVWGLNKGLKVVKILISVRAKWLRWALWPKGLLFEIHLTILNFTSSCNHFLLWIFNVNVYLIDTYIPVLYLNKDCLSKTNWSFTDFPPVHSPVSPCISLQWTIRDGQSTNVPVPLLVKDDIILLRPGQRVPAKCVIMREVYHFSPYCISDFRILLKV